MALLCSVSQAQVASNVFSYSRTSSFTYETGSVPSKGLLKTETVEPDQSDLCVVTSYVYDDFGNKKSATTANCAGASSTAQFAPRTSSSSFGTDGQFPVSSTNAIGQSETKTYDKRFGTLATLVGPNNLTTTITVDAFGRKTKELRADNTSTVTAYCYIEGKGIDTSSNSSTSNGDPLSCPATGGEVPTDAVSFIHSETRDTNGTKMGAFVRVYSDRQGRPLRTVTESFDGAAQTPGRSLALVAQDNYYNPQGAKIGASQPYFLASGSTTTTGSNDRGVSLTVYDVLGRPTAIYSADPTGSQTNVTVNGITIAKASVQTFVYQGLNITTTNDKGQTRLEEKNISGQVIRVTDASGAQLLHQHDAFGNLIETRDALQNKITINYDLRGRKIAMNDPDAGQSSYAYDALGQLRSQRNANQLTPGNPLYGSATTMDYDVLGRMISRAEPEYTSTWIYDTCTKGVGKLCSSTTSHGITKTMGYDSLGRPLNSRTDITNGPSVVSSVSYDGTTGRVATQTYPTGLQVAYGYTAGAGALEKLTLKTAANVTPLPATAGGTPAAPQTLPINTVLWQARVVNAGGKLEQSSTSNGVVSNAVFEAATGRVTTLTAGTGGTSNVLNQNFAWDSLNNLTARTDNIGDAVAGAVSESFQYADSLNRLTSYTVSAPSIAGAARTVTLQYNALGMLLYKNDVGNYSYPSQGPNSVRPHAVQNVVGAALNAGYIYDAAGNLMTATGAKYSAVTYTSFNLPTSLQGPSSTPQYAWQYDENHQRVKEVHVNASGTRTTWMLHPDNAGGLGFESEVSTGNTSNRHYLSAGGQTIGVLVSTGALPSLTAGQMAPTALSSMALSKVEYWYKDHLGSLVATADHAGTVTALYAYDPFGKRRYTNGNYDSFGNLVVDWTTNTVDFHPILTPPVPLEF